MLIKRHKTREKCPKYTKEVNSLDFEWPNNSLVDTCSSYHDTPPPWCHLLATGESASGKIHPLAHPSGQSCVIRENYVRKSIDVVCGPVLTL